MPSRIAPAAAAFAWNAWSGLDFGLGEDIDQLRDLVRRFSDDRIAPRALMLIAVEHDATTPEDQAEATRREQDRWAQVVRGAGLKPE